MSGRLKNPLDGFQSYSTHFILLACRTTEQARAFAQGAETETLQKINETKSLGGPVNFKGSDSDVFLVLDTRRFSQFSVESLKYEVLINGLQSKGSHGNLANEVHMTILDSVGISFINYLQWLMDSKMQCGFDGMIFMMRVIFVGHHEDGSTETVQTVTIPMHLFKMDVNLDYAKGAYECVFMPNFNFAVNTHQRWLNIGTSTNYFTGKTNTLGDLIDSFETSLNNDSSEFYKTISAAVLKAGAQPQTSDANKFGRIVQYQITIPDKWRQFTCDGSSVHAAIEKTFVKKEKTAQTTPQQASTAGGKDLTPATSTYMSVDPGLTITAVLEMMFKACSDIQKLGNADKLLQTNEFITFYKHLVSISSDNNSFVVHVDVIPFEVPNVVPPKQDQATLTAQHQGKFYEEVTDERTGKKIMQPVNFFELDYIFTGKNLDILHFDLKLQDLQFLLASNVKVSEGDLFNVSGQGQGDKAQPDGTSLPKTLLTSARQYDPIMLPLLTPEQRKAFSQYATARTPSEQQRKTADSQAYARNLSAFYAQSPIMVNMTIKGNPDIMEKFNHDKPVPHTTSTSATGTGTSTTNTTVKGAYREQLEADILKLNDGKSVTKSKNGFSIKRPLGDASYTTTPVFAKINIKGPNVDPTTNELIDGQDFAAEVLYNNYYVVFKVTNIIQRGVFTQELEMWSHNVYGQGKLSAENIKDKQKTTVR
jgi:hypothetical protein